MSTTYESMTRTELIAELLRRDGRTAGAEGRGAAGGTLAGLRDQIQVLRKGLLEIGDDLDEFRARSFKFFEYAPIACLTLALDGTIAEINRKALLLLGLDGWTGEGISFLSFIPEGSRRTLQDHLDRSRGTEGAAGIDLELVAPAGSPRIPVRLSTIYHRGREGQDLYLAALVEDAGEAREPQAGAERHLAHLAHELRAPLTPIVAALESLVDQPGIPRQARSDLSMVRQNVTILLRLVEDLLDAARLSRGALRIDPRIVDVHRILRGLVHSCAFEASARGLRIECSLAARDFLVRADPVRLQQVFGNILRNALKFTPAGGKIAISTRIAGGDEGARPAVLAVSIEDDGIGIEPERIAGLFAGGPSSESIGGERGLGLGLAISKGLVEAQGGTIQAESAGKGKGSTFTVELPLQGPGQEEIAHES